MVTQAAPAAPKKIDLRVATLPFFVPRTEEMVYLYQAAHPEVTVEIEPIPGDYTQKMMTLVAGGTLQDVIWTGNGFIEQLVLEGACPDMKPVCRCRDPQPYGRCLGADAGGVHLERRPVYDPLGVGYRHHVL